jgi:transposase
VNVRYRAELNQEERDQLHKMLSGGRHAARKFKRAQILLAADAGESDEAIAANISVGGSTVYRTKRRFVEGNLELALSEEPRPGATRKLSGKEQALLVATACSSPPQGRARWTLELLAGEMVKLTEHRELSRETVRRRLEENELKPWRQDMWCIPESLRPRRRGSMAPMSLAWRTCSISTPRCPIPRGRGVFRRKPDAAHRRNTPTHPGRARTAPTLRLRISPQWHGQHVRLP